MTLAENPTWPPGVTRLLDQAKLDVDEILAGKEVRGAVELTANTGLPFQTRQFPMYFTGDFSAQLVLVHLNPKFSTQMDKPGYCDFDEYLDGHRRFGHLHWEMDPTYKSQFDQKQVRFLRPFGAIDFLDDADPRHTRTNPARVIDQKLQLELVPYASPDFPAHRFSLDDLRPHFERVLGVISAFPRRYVLFCGAVFDELLERSDLNVTRESHKFHLPIKSGENSKGEYHFSNVALPYRGTVLHAGVARSFATQGLPMRAYGIKCHELYANTNV